MNLEAHNPVSAEEFCKNFDKYAAAVQRGDGVVAVTQDSKVVGFFVSPEEYEVMYNEAIRKLLASRMKGPTISHEEARAHVLETIRRRSHKP
jgi:hypothetical protein